jgi:hypothetical protein
MLLEHPSGKLWDGAPREESRNGQKPLGKMPCTKSELRYIYAGKKALEDSLMWPWSLISKGITQGLVAAV